MLKHNSYFEGQVQSIGFTRNGRSQTAGVIGVGAYHFNTDSAERMTIVSGELKVVLPGQPAQVYPAGTSFEVPGKSSFEVEAAAPVAYLCEFL